MSVELRYGLPARVDARLTRDWRLYPTVMQMNLAECHDALHDFRRSVRSLFGIRRRVSAERACERAGGILVEMGGIGTLPGLEARRQCVEGCLDAVDEIRGVVRDIARGPFTVRFRRRGADLCRSLRKLIFQAHDEWCPSKP